MLKMTVSPLDSRNSSIPNRTPLSVEMTTNSSTAHSLNDQANHGKEKSLKRPASRSGGITPVRSSHRGYAESTAQGRFMLQVVATVACGVSILDTRCQPQPVPSSSNGSLALSAMLPSEEM